MGSKPRSQAEIDAATMEIKVCLLRISSLRLLFSCCTLLPLALPIKSASSAATQH